MAQLWSVLVDFATDKNPEFAGLRDEMRTGYASLRDEMHVGFGNLQRELLSNKIWMFSLVGGILAVMAHGFKWI